jgi:hypothetical protein
MGDVHSGHSSHHPAAVPRYELAVRLGIHAIKSSLGSSQLLISEPLLLA